MTNSLLESAPLPNFADFSIAEVTPAVDQLLARSRQVIADAINQSGDNPSWDTLAGPLEQVLDDINNGWSVVGHLNSVANSEALRQSYEENQQKITEFYTELGQNQALYQAYGQLSSSDTSAPLPQDKRKAVENSLRSFTLAGVALPDEKRLRYAQIQQRLSTITTQFSNNALDATQGWTLHLDNLAELDGAPEFIVKGAAAKAAEKSLDGYVLTLDLPVYFTVMSQVKSEGVRRRMYEAFVTKASDQGPCAGQWDNSALIEEILQLRQESAQLLGFANYAEYSLAPKMADSPQQVLDFLQTLAAKAKPQAEIELQALRAFARDEFGVERINAWDLAYYSEQLKLQQHNVSQELLRPYFPIDTVLAGMFQLVETLFGINIVESSSSVWDPQVRFFHIERKGQKIASFYLDLYARANKRGGAWMADARVRTEKYAVQQLPVAYLVCNFNAPQGDATAQLTHSEVTTLFHEFGHGLHHMLTEINTASVSGINGVAWDAVELPSQFLENFCWQEEVLAFISGHVDTGEALPEDLLANMLAAKNFQTAMMTVRQIEFALFDLRLHMAYGSAEFNGVQALLDEVRQEVAVSIPPAFNRFQNSFTHIFAGGYAAGYYSYKWAELLSADAFSRFEEEGLLSDSVGEDFRTHILSRGGSEDAAVLFARFRGRQPNIDALLRHSGIQA